MTLTGDAALHAVARTLREQVSPALQAGFLTDVLRMAANQVEIAARNWDDAAALRVEENAALRTLFDDAAGLVADQVLATELAKAARSVDPGLRISQLDAENGRLRALLVQLHAVVEQDGSDAAQAIDRRIWRLLADIEQRRAPRV